MTANKAAKQILRGYFFAASCRPTHKTVAFYVAIWFSVSQILHSNLTKFFDHWQFLLQTNERFNSGSVTDNIWITLLANPLQKGHIKQ